LGKAILNAFSTTNIALKQLKPTKNSIFSIHSSPEFEAAAMAVFRYQANENEVYSQYLETLGRNPDTIQNTEQIPFLPVSFFKDLTVISGKEHAQTVFTSSGTAGMTTSRHHVTDISIYEESYLKGFSHFYGNIGEYCILALLPSYLEREGSSLIYMADDLIRKSSHPESGFYLHNYKELVENLATLKKQGQKTILLGVTYALLDLIEQFPELRNNSWDDLIVMETGGMKGKRKEMVREELHENLCRGFGLQIIHSEYGMTELLSQAYSKGNGIFNCPPWMKILIRDTNDPFTFLPENKSGGINVIDLANINACSFIATQDLGKRHVDGSFEVLGRFDNSDIRGCNLLIV
jgi:phenylacetate-coenzyme A ligase PaaK-like adenylate-forming protein